MNTVPARGGRPRVIHFVTGGGSGVTKAVLDVASGHLRSGIFEVLVVLRRKPSPLPASMQQQIATDGLPTAWVDSGFNKARTRNQLRAIIADFKPDIFAAHGNSEHLWGRQAALMAKVRTVIHVEHCTERYTFWRRWATRRLAARTTATICVSQSVAEHAVRSRLVSSRVEVIPNGTDVARFAHRAPPFDQRGQDIVMMARFARQKDQPTLIRATALLVARGWTGRLLLGGAGNPLHRRRCQRLAARLGIADRVDFLGQVSDTVSLYHRCRAAVLSTHYEGLPLALLESMAGGCATIGSGVPGVVDIIQSGVTGWIFPHGDEEALARLLAEVLAGGEEINTVVARGQTVAAADFSIARQLARYETLFNELLVSPLEPDVE